MHVRACARVRGCLGETEGNHHGARHQFLQFSTLGSIFTHTLHLNVLRRRAHKQYGTGGASDQPEHLAETAAAPALAERAGARTRARAHVLTSACAPVLCAWAAVVDLSVRSVLDVGHLPPTGARDDERSRVGEGRRGERERLAQPPVYTG